MEGVRVGYFPGRFDAFKGFPLIADALQSFLEGAISRLHFVLVGSDHSDAASQEAVSRLVAWMGEGENQPPLQVRPRQSLEMTQHLAATTGVTLLASAYENFPYVALEAMAAGRLVIAPRVGGLPEMIEDGVTGLLFEPGSALALGECLRRVNHDPHLVARLGRSARGAVERRFSVDEGLPTVEVYYAHLIGRKRHRRRLRQRPWGWWLPHRGPLRSLLLSPLRALFQES